MPKGGGGKNKRRENPKGEAERDEKRSQNIEEKGRVALKLGSETFFLRLGQWN